GVVNIGGPEKLSFADLARTVLAHRGENTPVVVDPSATYFGTPVAENSLVTGDDAVLAPTRFEDWLAAH
ncbi:MAG: LysR family transcriptional regulator, partial [Acidimicrobiales bacterium]